MDAIELLENHADRILSLCDEAMHTRRRFELDAVFAGLADAVAIRVDLCEALLFPMAQACGAGVALVEARRRHQTVKSLLESLLDDDSPILVFQLKVTFLREQVERCLQAERLELWPALRRLLDTDARRQLGEQMRARARALEGSQPRYLVRDALLALADPPPLPT
jgi:hypothetical protein